MFALSRASRWAEDLRVSATARQANVPVQTSRSSFEATSLSSATDDVTVCEHFGEGARKNSRRPPDEVDAPTRWTRVKYNCRPEKLAHGAQGLYGTHVHVVG